jgi:carboxyl-terminal processing protease
MNMRIIRFFLIVLSAGLIGYYIGITKISYDWNNFRPQISVESKEPPPSMQKLDLAQLWQVLNKLEANYYDPKAIDSQKLLNGAISGMVNSLEDPYTVYLPPQQNTDFKQGLAGKFEGIGAELGMKGKQIIVVAPLDGSPAQKAGVKAGDSVLKVDDKPTFGWTLNQAVEKIRGPKGTEVKLTVQHKAEDKPVDLKLTRDTIQVKSITSWVKNVKDIDEINQSNVLKANPDDKVAYVRLSQFGDTANQEWVNFANNLALQLNNDKSIKGVVLDLRNNPGGYLTDAVFISSEFLKNGTVVIQDDGKGNQVKMDVSRKGLLTDIPVLVLINKGSASASEIVSGALRDHSRAKLVGETSFGKGTIQQAEDLGEGAGLHVTIAKWLTPNQTWVHTKGLKPDIEVALDTKDPSRDAQLEKAVEELVKN